MNITAKTSLNGFRDRLLGAGVLTPLMILVTITPLVNVNAEIIEFTMKSQWQSLVPHATTINFSEFYPPTWYITNEYEELGVIFTKGDYLPNASSAFTNDGIGLSAIGFGTDNDYITLEFIVPMSTIAIDFPGACQVFLYDGSDLFYASGFLSGACSIGCFRGIVSTQPFTKAVLTDPLDGINIDDLHFSAIPVSTGACCLLDAACENNRIEWGCLAVGGVYQGDGTTCDGPPCEPACHEDTNEDGIVNITDLLAVITAWGPCPSPCPLSCAPDVNFNCTVNMQDLLQVISAWGACQ